VVRRNRSGLKRNAEVGFSVQRASQVHLDLEVDFLP
jgi:hypothetical protein